MPDSAPRPLTASEIGLTNASAPRRRRMRWAVVSVASVAAALLAMPRIAEAGPRIAVSAGSCPNRDAMIFALAQVLPSASIVPPTEALLEGGEPMAVVAVSDDATSYQVQVGNIARTFLDPSARCEERAGKAAVVVALALEPPQFVILQPGAPAPAPEAQPAPAGAPVPVAPLAVPVAQPLLTPGVWVEAGGAVEYARPRPFPYENYFMQEVTLRFAVERGDLGLVVGTAVPGWVRNRDGDAGIERLPIELLLRLRHSLGPISVVFDAGPALVFQRVTSTAYAAFGLGPQQTRTDTEIDLRGGVRIELRSERGYGAFVGATGSYAPDPLDLNGFKLKGWIGAGAGLMMQLR